MVGLLLVGVALAGSFVQRLPLSTAMLYLAVGYGLGPRGVGLLRLDPFDHSSLLMVLAEIAVLISLFTAGLKLRLPLNDARWRPAVRLAFGSMSLTVLMIALAGVYGLGLSGGAAVLLGAILAPTDPVLASDVQVSHPFDYNRLRFCLTGEAGFNDGTAFPFIMLGLGLLGLHDLGPGASLWIGVDVVWGIAGGLAIGMLLGTGVVRLVLYLRREHREAVGLDDFLAMGLIGLTYGVALLCHTYGFLAVFASGLALRRMEREQSPEAGAKTRETDENPATDPAKAPAFMAKAVLKFNEQLERLAELLVVVVIGSMLTWSLFPRQALWFLPLLFLVIRPVSVAAGLIGTTVPAKERRLMAWFGIRGIGSLYYLMYAIEHGLAGEEARLLVGIALAALAASIVVHGISVTPLMRSAEKPRS